CSYLSFFFLSGESNHVEVNVREDSELTFEFASCCAKEKFELYKEDRKIGSSPSTIRRCLPPAAAPTQFCIIRVFSYNITLLFSNLTVNSSGLYHLVVYVENQKESVIFSNRVNLTVTEPTVPTVSEPTSTTSNNSSLVRSQSDTLSRYICSTVMISLVLALVGLLVWFCRIYRRESGDTPALTANTAQQGICPVSSTVPAVSCIEYGVLDFQNQPNRPERYSNPEVGDRDVEYAAIMFPPRKQRT
ncbi:hypothetical protein NFI96_011366, partial [Prochilodus magdalenae]